MTNAVTAPSAQDLLANASLEGLEELQVEDLRKVYPLLRTAQQMVVEMHVDTAMHLLLEKSLRVFYYDRQRSLTADSSSVHASSITALEDMLKTVGIMQDTSHPTPMTIGHAYTEYQDFFTGALPPERVEAAIPVLADALLPYCHNSTTWQKTGAMQARIDEFVTYRQSITEGANAHEADIRTFLAEPHHSEADQAEVKRYLRDFWSWRDGGLDNLPPYPSIAGFPIPFPPLPKTLGVHPLVKEVEEVSQTLFYYARNRELNALAKPLEILESGQKSLGRILEKAREKKEMPSGLHDLVRAMVLTEDLGDIHRFQELFRSYAHLHDHVHADALTIVPWHMRATGYSDTKMLGKIQLGGMDIDFESMAKFPAERSAEMSSHRLYDMKRSAWRESVKAPESDTSFANAVAAYDAVMVTLNPQGDAYAGKTIQAYGARRVGELTERNAVTQALYESRPIGDMDLPSLPAERKALLATMGEVLDDVHTLYHLAAASRTRGVPAALSAVLYERMCEKRKQDPLASLISEFVPRRDEAAATAPTTYNPYRGHYTAADREQAETLLAAQEPHVGEGLSRAR